MPFLNSQSGAASRLTPRKTIKPVNFACFAPDAKAVALVGDFNDWDPAATAMKRRPDGSWTAQIDMGHGHHHYLFLVDGKPVLDPKAQGIARNEKNEKVSLIAV
jgi:1,4-alpha-glucan branching enzyme